MGAVRSHWKHDLDIVRFPPEGCAFNIGSRVGAAGSRRKNIHALKEVRAFSDERLCVSLGAEWEPSGAATKT